MSDKSNGCVWTNEAVTLLLTLYLREKQKERPVKLKKKEIWKRICAELWGRGVMCSWQECDKKYRNLKQTFVRNLKQAGKKECRWLFFPIMFEINKQEPFVSEMFATSTCSTTGGIPSDNEFAENCEPCDHCEPEEATSSNEATMNVEENLSPAPSDLSMITMSSHHFQQSPPLPPSFHEYVASSSHFIPPSLLSLALKRPSKSPSPQRQNSPQCSSPYLSPKSEFDDDTVSNSKKFKFKTAAADSSGSPEPPDWFKMFLLEFHRSENLKFQQIKELCDCIRRKNEIEDRRNAILNEKNDLLKNLIDLMSTK